jgi:hypothetical protein
MVKFPKAAGIVIHLFPKDADKLVKFSQFISGIPKWFYNNSRGFRDQLMLWRHTKALWTQESR